MTAPAVVSQRPARHQGAAARRVGCASQSSFNPNDGGLAQDYAFSLEGELRRDCQQIQKIQT